MKDSLKTEIIIKSVTKIAQQDGIPVFVVKKGDPDSGIILICLLYTSDAADDQ